jgi:transcriptional regulator with XRE-family HTH domain
MASRGLTPEEVVGRRIAQARQDQRFRQEDLGAELARYLAKKWTKQAISETERGNRKLNPTELLAFAAALGYPVSWFFLPPTTGAFPFPGFRFPDRIVPISELEKGPLLGAENPDIRQALEQEQKAILNSTRRFMEDVQQRVRELHEITQRDSS